MTALTLAQTVRSAGGDVIAATRFMGKELLFPVERADLPEFLRGCLNEAWYWVIGDRFEEVSEAMFRKHVGDALVIRPNLSQVARRLASRMAELDPVGIARGAADPQYAHFHAREAFRPHRVQLIPLLMDLFEEGGAN